MSSNARTFEAPPSSPETAKTEGMNAVLARNWWAVALRGLFAILFGFIAFLMPGATILALVLVFSAYMLADGVLGIVSAVRAARRNERWGLLVFQGIASILAGIAALLWPGITVLVFVTLVAAWSIVSGGLVLAAAVRLRIDHGRWWLALSGLLSVIFGVLLVIAPLAGAVVLTWWIGAYALVFGVSLLVLAYKLREHRHDRPQSLVPQGA
jgi:uncharacterized membrane protein HdeD (DUF308 family)